MQLAGKGACLTPHHDTVPYPACPLPPLPCRYLELPVSTTHSIVGAVIGMSMVAAGAGSGGWCGRLGRGLDFGMGGRLALPLHLPLHLPLLLILFCQHCGSHHPNGCMQRLCGSRGRLTRVCPPSH